MKISIKGKVAACFFFVGVCSISFGQQFVEVQQLELPDSVEIIKTEWIDMDNDGLLDILLVAQNLNGQFLYTFKNDTINGFSFEHTIATTFTTGVYQLADYNGDNKIDVAVTGTMAGEERTTILLNQGNFLFATPGNLLIEKMGTCLQFADFNNDGSLDMVLSGVDADGLFLNIYSQSPDGWHVVNDSLKIHATEIKAFDFDGDMFMDLMISGIVENDKPYTTVLYSDGNFGFERYFEFPDPVVGAVEIGDITNDGLFDAVLSGVDLNSQFRILQFTNQVESGQVEDSAIQLESGTTFLADFDSDGILDIHYYGKNGLDTVNLIALSSGAQAIVDHQDLQQQNFGDYDLDGDLDILQIVSGAMKIYENTVPVKNEVPSKPPFAFSIPIYNRTFFYWDESTDDHTPSSALTYDVALRSVSSDKIPASFDASEKTRLTVSHGNKGTNNFLLLNKQLEDFVFEVQSIDNSFHGGVVCEGVSACQVPVTTQAFTACTSEEVTFEAPHEVMWFSFADGFLGTNSELIVTAEKSDTLFYYDRNTGGVCGSIGLFPLHVPNNFVRESITTKEVCLDEIIPFSVEASWDSVAWSSEKQGFLTNEPSLNFKAEEADVLTVYLLKRPGCIDIRKTELIILSPEVEVNGEVFQIMKGESIQLEASGGETYNWSPTSGLSNPQISNPIASPQVTTEYQVTISNSIGCSVLKKVLVKVEQTAFIPSLFTPNQDGNNDYLKVYGMFQSSGYRLKVYNREGNIVFETSDPAAVGWDGTKSGMEQPSGVYYWKVEGTYSNGTKVLLNGKSSGSVVLIR